MKQRSWGVSSMRRGSCTRPPAPGRDLPRLLSGAALVFFCVLFVGTALYRSYTVYGCKVNYFRILASLFQPNLSLYVVSLSSDVSTLMLFSSGPHSQSSSSLFQPTGHGVSRLTPRLSAFPGASAPRWPLWLSLRALP